MNDETLINSMEPAWSRQVFKPQASYACRVLGNGAADTGPMAGICPEGFRQIAPTGPTSSQVIYFFAVFSVHYVGEVFRDDVVTSNLSSNMGETMFTLPETEVFKRCQKHSKVHKYPILIRIDPENWGFPLLLWKTILQQFDTSCEVALLEWL